MWTLHLLCLLLGSATDGFILQPHVFSGSSSNRALSQQKQEQQCRHEHRHFRHDEPLRSPPTVSRRNHRRSRLLLGYSPPSGSTSADDGDGLIIGLNKYSHDTSVCVLSALDGSCLFAGEKERLTRAKHDGGDTAGLVSHALESIGASLEDVRLVVSNNHHHRVAPFEQRVPWAVAMGTYPDSYAAPENLLPQAAHAELSHHLAHAWSAAALAPFDSGLIVVMDGMGESHGAMAKSEAAAESIFEQRLSVEQEQEQQQPQSGGLSAGSNELRQKKDDEEEEEEYYNDLRLMRELGAGGEMAEGAGLPGKGNPGFQQVPEELLPHEAYREAESAYTFVPGSGERYY